MPETLRLTDISLEKLPATASAILKYGAYAGSKVFAFYGPMGAGKTTLIKEICHQLGSHDNLSSPSYSLVNEYLIEGKQERIYHLDLFRLKSAAEALDLGITDYLNSNDYCFIEWPGLISDLLPGNCVKVMISSDDNVREMLIFIG